MLKTFLMQGLLFMESEWLPHGELGDYLDVENKDLKFVIR